MLEDHEALSQTPNRLMQRAESVGTPLLFSPTSLNAANFNLMKPSYDETFTLSNFIEL